MTVGLFKFFHIRFKLITLSTGVFFFQNGQRQPFERLRMHVVLKRKEPFEPMTILFEQLLEVFEQMTFVFERAAAKKVTF